MVIYIFGTGTGAKNFYLNKIKKEVVIKGFLDSDCTKWGKSLSFAPEHIIKSTKELEEPYNFIVLASVYPDAYSYLISEGISNEKIIILNDYTNNDVLNICARKRFTLLKEMLKEEYIQEVAEVENIFPMGNYSSSVVDIQYIRNNEDEVFKKQLSKESAIELNINNQVELFNQFSKIGEILPFCDQKKDELRFYGKNDMFQTGSAHILSHIIMKYRPEKVIEVGSGFSSAVMLDLNENIFNNKIELSFIEPYPQRLKSILKEEDNIVLLESKLQDIPLDFFESLGEGDILFIDSSHVSKTGSDVNYIIFEILPCLKHGVVIHFHDIFYPFEYPKRWVYEGRGWNENYILRAFLQYNSQFEIIFWDSALARWLELKKDFLELNDIAWWLRGGSIYIQKK